MKMGRKIWHHKRSLMQIDKDIDRSSNIGVRALIGWSVGHVVRNILREVFFNIRVVGLRYIVHKICGLLGM